MSEQKLRKFRLIDKEGFINSNPLNSRLLNYLESGCFTGSINEKEGSLQYSGLNLIVDDEFQFFEEIPLEENNIQQTSTINGNEPLNNEVSATLSDEMIQCIKEDCHAVNGSLCFYKEGVVFLWNEDEYFIESVEDYNKAINSIKVLNSMKK